LGYLANFNSALRSSGLGPLEDFVICVYQANVRHLF